MKNIGMTLNSSSTNNMPSTTTAAVHEKPHLPKGRGKEAASLGRGGGTGRDRVGNHNLWYPPRPGHLLQVSWNSSIGGGQ